eukprot:1157029-Pelagomonas_calceolata.AAC.4
MERTLALGAVQQQPSTPSLTDLPLFRRLNSQPAQIHGFMVTCAALLPLMALISPSDRLAVTTGPWGFNSGSPAQLCFPLWQSPHSSLLLVHGLAGLPHGAQDVAAALSGLRGLRASKCKALRCPRPCSCAWWAAWPASKEGHDVLLQTSGCGARALVQHASQNVTQVQRQAHGKCS